MLGIQLKNKGLADEAMKVFQVVVDKFPNSAYAPKAIDQIDAIGQAKKQ